PPFPRILTLSPRATTIPAVRAHRNSQDRTRHRRRGRCVGHPAAVRSAASRARRAPRADEEEDVEDLLRAIQRRHRRQGCAARRVAFEVVSVPAETPTDVPDASAALMSRDIDAVLQMPGNLTASAFGSIGEAARRAHLPVFAFQKSQAIGGAMVVVARDYNDSGRHAAHLAARIMRGENPKKIPLEDFAKTSLIVNLDAARALDITLPPALVQSAKDVIGDANGNR